MSTFYEPGRYACVVTQQALGKTSKDNPQLVLRVRVMGVYTAPNEVEPFDRQWERTIYRVITEKTMEYVRRDLEALNAPVRRLSELDPSNPHGVSLVGNEVDCQCRHEDYNGDTVERWSIAWKPGEHDLDAGALSAQEMRSLDAMFAAGAKAAGGAAPPYAPPAARQAAPAGPPPPVSMPRQNRPAPAAAPPPTDWGNTITDDDLPF